MKKILAFAVLLVLAVVVVQMTKDDKLSGEEILANMTRITVESPLSNQFIVQIIKEGVFTPSQFLNANYREMVCLLLVDTDSYDCGKEVDDFLERDETDVTSQMLKDEMRTQFLASYRDPADVARLFQKKKLLILNTIKGLPFDMRVDYYTLFEENYYAFRGAARFLSDKQIASLDGARNQGLSSLDSEVQVILEEVYEGFFALDDLQKPLYERAFRRYGDGGVELVEEYQIVLQYFIDELKKT